MNDIRDESIENGTALFGGRVQDAKSIDSITSAAVERNAQPAAAAKRGRGRPRKVQGMDSMAGPSPAGNEGRGTVSKDPALHMASVDPVLIEKTIKTLCTIVDNVLVGRMERTLKVLVPNDPSFAEEVARESRMQEDEKNLISQLGATCSIQYGILGQHAPLILLAIAATGYAARQYWGFQRINQILQQIKRTRTPSRESIEPGKPAGESAPAVGTPVV